MAASLGGSQTITFAPGLTGTISLGAGLEIGSSVTIDGPGASLLTVSGGGPSSNFSDFTVDSGVTATISGLTIANGYTTNDGGGVSNGGDLTLSDDTVTGNSAYFGGGIYDAGTATLENDTISDNSAYDGGGVLSAGVVTLINATLFGNSATYGGGIGNHATVVLTNVTIAGNSAVDGGGGIADGGTATLNNSLLASNSGGDIDFGTVSGYNNLVDDAANAGGLSNGINGNIVGVNPLLAAPGNYGGPTQTIALLPGSPAIDAGDTALAVDGRRQPVDHRPARPAAGGRLRRRHRRIRVIGVHPGHRRRQRPVHARQYGVPDGARGQRDAEQPGRPGRWRRRDLHRAGERRLGDVHAVGAGHDRLGHSHP